MQNFADKLIEAIKERGTPCIVGLDPRFELIPKSFFSETEDKTKNETIEDVIFDFNCTIIDAVKDLVPAVKLQTAFYEQYGVPGMWAFNRSLTYAKEAGLLVIVDGKRNDIGSTAAAYANAYLGRANILDNPESRIFDADALTVSPYLGGDSLTPFVEACKKYGKGIFILVKTSNPGSGDFQNQVLKETNEPLYKSVAKMVADLGNDLVGEHGYSSIGAVVGATYPEEAAVLRSLMPKAFFLVPGYGAQGGTAKDTLPSFNADGLGALVNASRSITFNHEDLSVSKEEYASIVRENTQKMIADIQGVLK